MPGTRDVRRTARVLCIDEHGSVLLLRTHWDGRLAPPRWLTPGGGIEAGETELEAAVRELFEETGQRVDPERLVGPIGHSRIPHPPGHRYAAADAVVFVLRTERFAVSDEHWMDDERDDILEVRWWHPDEIRASDDVFSDEDVLAHLARVESGAPQPGDAVRVEGVKWDGKPHWRYDAHVLGSDTHGTWIGVDAGTTVQKGWRKEYLSGHAFVRLIPPTTPSWLDGTWRLPGWWHHSDVDAYVDVCTPPTIRRGDDGWIVEYTDLDLDLVVPASGLKPWIDDEDEFMSRSISQAWPRWVIQRARAESDRLAAVAAGEGLAETDAGHAWLARLAAEAPDSAAPVAERLETPFLVDP